MRLGAAHQWHLRSPAFTCITAPKDLIACRCNLRIGACPWNQSTNHFASNYRVNHTNETAKHSPAQLEGTSSKNRQELIVSEWPKTTKGHQIVRSGSCSHHLYLDLDLTLTIRISQIHALTMN